MMKKERIGNTRISSMKAIWFCNPKVGLLFQPRCFCRTISISFPTMCFSLSYKTQCFPLCLCSDQLIWPKKLLMTCWGTWKSLLQPRGRSSCFLWLGFWFRWLPVLAVSTSSRRTKCNLSLACCRAQIMLCHSHNQLWKCGWREKKSRGTLDDVQLLIGCDIDSKVSSLNQVT